MKRLAYRFYSVAPALTLGLSGLGLAGVTGGCGSSVPDHTGYPQNVKSPWSGAEELKVNDANQASLRRELSYPKRERARWHVLDLPDPGSLEIQVDYEPIRTPKEPPDIGVEVLDSGFNVLAEGVDEDEEGSERKTRNLPKVAAGKTYIHVYTLGKLDEVEYRVRLTYAPKPEARRVRPVVSSAPIMPVLASIGRDDTPKRTGGGTRLPVEKPDPPVEKPPAGALRATITEATAGGGGVRIVINKGSNSGVEKDTPGRIMRKDGKGALPRGSFKVKEVSQFESVAVVQATLEDVNANKAVLLELTAPPAP